MNPKNKTNATLIEAYEAAKDGAEVEWVDKRGEFFKATYSDNYDWLAWVDYNCIVFGGQHTTDWKITYPGQEKKPHCPDCGHFLDTSHDCSGCPGDETSFAEKVVAIREDSEYEPCSRDEAEEFRFQYHVSKEWEDWQPISKQKPVNHKSEYRRKKKATTRKAKPFETTRMDIAQVLHDTIMKRCSAAQAAKEIESFVNERIERAAVWAWADGEGE